MSTMPPVSDPRFDPDHREPEEPKKKRSAWATCLIGCLVMLAVLLVLGALLTYWIARQWRSLAAEGAQQGMKQIIAESSLPADEQADINVQVDRLAKAFRENRISMVEGAEFVQNLGKSPLMTSIAASAIGGRYFDRSGLTDEDKAAGKITLERFLRGILDGKIDQQGIDTAMAHVATRQANGEWRIRRNVSDADLRAFLAAAKAAADEAGVPAEPPKFDPSDEFKRLVDEALNEQELAAPVEAPDANLPPPARPTKAPPLPESGQ